MTDAADVFEHLAECQSMLRHLEGQHPFMHVDISDTQALEALLWVRWQRACYGLDA